MIQKTSSECRAEKRGRKYEWKIHLMLPQRFGLSRNNSGIVISGWSAPEKRLSFSCFDPRLQPWSEGRRTFWKCLWMRDMKDCFVKGRESSKNIYVQKWESKSRGSDIHAYCLKGWKVKEDQQKGTMNFYFQVSSLISKVNDCGFISFFLGFSKNFEICLWTQIYFLPNRFFFVEQTN